MDPRKFWTMCRIHDWFYMMSDDPVVYRDGFDSEKELSRIAAKSPKLTEVYEAWREHMLGTGPKPAEPKMEE